MKNLGFMWLTLARTLRALRAAERILDRETDACGAVLFPRIPAALPRAERAAIRPKSSF